MEKEPNPFDKTPGTKARSFNHESRLNVRRRRAIVEWYEARRIWARERYKQWVRRRTYENRGGMITFDMMGRVAVNSAAHAESDPVVRNRRRAYLMRKWQQFMRNAL
ncbi:MAG: hypothetical protein ACQR33_00290 [Candidatus Saccharibacteria bacterium]